MIEMILALVAVSLLIGLIYYNKKDKKIDIPKVSLVSISEDMVRFSSEMVNLINKWQKEVNKLSKKRRNNVSKKRKTRTNKTKKTGNRKR
jgi:hypothetical protein